MHLIIAALVIVITWKWGDWRNWKLYYPTMLFFAAGDLVYDFVFFNKPLWLNISPYLPNALLELIWIFVIFPCTIFFYLRHYPKKIISQIFYIIKWVLGYTFVELMLYSFGYFLYQNGWNIWWSIVFNCFMFSVLRLHYLKPLWALFFSGVFLVIIMNIFNVSVSK